MWRLLRARLHPDAGGDLELFLFVSALRDRDRDAVPSDGQTEAGIAGAENPAEPFLKSWQVSMNYWASRNQEALRSFAGSKNPAISMKD